MCAIWAETFQNTKKITDMCKMYDLFDVDRMYYLKMLTIVRPSSDFKCEHYLTWDSYD